MDKLKRYWNRKDQKWNLVSLDDLSKRGIGFSHIDFEGYVMVKEHYTTKELIQIIIKRQINKIKKLIKCQIS